VKRVKLTSEWLAGWVPRRQEEVADAVCRGLLARAGPSGAKTFYQWTDAPNPETGKTKRKRVAMGRWSPDGGRGTLSLGEARDAFLKLQEEKTAEVAGTAEVTVGDLAKAYSRDVLARRGASGRAWSWGVIGVHVLDARLDPKRPPFGEWPARTVRAPDLAAVVRLARVERTVTRQAKGKGEVSRRLGGPSVARAVLAELKAIFGNAVGSGTLDATPAAVLRGTALGLTKVKRGRNLNERELAALFTALDLTALLDGIAKPQRLSPTVRLGLAFLLYVPVRSHSFIGARWEEVDLDSALWTVPVARLKLKQGARAAASDFIAPLPSTAVTILRRLQELAGESHWVLASPVEPKKHIGEKVLVRAMARLQEGGRLALGSRVTVHDLRRTWRTWAGALRVPFDVAEKHLGHVLPGVADVYDRSEMVEQRAQAAELVGAVFDRIRLGTAAPVVPLAERAARPSPA